MTEHGPSRQDTSSPVKTGMVWIVGHASRFLPVAIVAVVGALTWQAVRQVHPRDVVMVLHGMQAPWLIAAAVLTVLNIGVMGLYDLMAFRHTRARPRERWQYGAVAFAWSNFLTLGPFAGPAIRFWLYKRSVEHRSDLETGVLSISIAFASGLGGWTVAALVTPASGGLLHTTLIAAIAAVTVYLLVFAARLIAFRIERFDDIDPRPQAAIGPAFIGWLDWFLASLAFVACLRSTGAAISAVASTRSFFFGQAIGLASLIPGGFGSSDAFWIAHLPLAVGVTTGALVAYRLVYYIVPWAAASLVLLSWATRRASRRVELARRMVAGLVAAGGGLMLLSTSTRALSPRLDMLEKIVPLPIVEVSHVAAALTGVLLLVLARGLAKGYRAALGATIGVLLLAAVSSVLKGLDYEEAVILTGLAVAAWSQAPLFDRPSGGPWFTARDLAVAALALFLFLGFGAFTYRLTPASLERVRFVGYRFERGRYLRTAGTLAIAVTAGALYVLLRVSVGFTRLREDEIDRTLELHAAIGQGTSAMMVANGDKAVFRFGDRGFCLYRTIGPYLVVFADPSVASGDDRADFLNALFAFAAEIDRRPLFYQISLEWIPPLHDRGYAFFKLGEEAHVPLRQVSSDGPQGKLYRQILRRGERDGLQFRVLAPFEIEAVMPELRAISDDWLEAKGTRERQFSIGFFDEAYVRRFPCAIVERHGRVVAFANLLRGPRRQELSIDLMRYRSEGPHAMDFLFASLLFYGKELGFERFNLGMAPLASVGRFQGAHARERLANLLFQHGENWYNFQGLRFYKAKFDPVWMPRYMAYQNAWEWPAAITNVSALVAGGWANVMRGKPQNG
ncbi:MAG TPA: bifunctional lysylphosphatidylglycerol flippase/synthetase MprF [Vicinamibacterales bacterium]|nr:bifunctional lysylphosphatidylglycerol flippase/synthetase MprF [Vicinamibacterales bacterium]